MAHRKIINKTDPLRTGEAFTQGNLPGGPYIAEVKSVGDPTKNNRISVALLDASSLSSNDDHTKWIDVTIALPYYGATPYTTATNSRSLDTYDAGTSYGITIPEPDIGTKCLVVFANGNRANGYVIAFIPGPFQNTTTTGRGVAKPKGKIAFTEADKTEFEGTGIAFPVLEKNLKSLGTTNLSAIQKLEWAFDKVMATILKTQGLLFDTIRGVTSSSIERESPNDILGMSSKGRPIPDPEDNPAILEKYKNSPETLTFSEVDTLSRKPGHSLTLDDGSIDGENNLIRLRSGKGAQILLHDKKDLIYIANSQGTAWVELSSDGKIDIFSNDSISAHTKGDFNFTADRNFNVTAENINMMASGNTDIVTTGITSIDSGETIGLRATGHILQKGAQIHMNSDGNLPPDHTGELVARIPNHEPWGQHEDGFPYGFKLTETAAGNTNQVSITIGVDGVIKIGSSSTGE